MNNNAYIVIVDKDKEQEVPVITKEQIQQFKKDLENTRRVCSNDN